MAQEEAIKSRNFASEINIGEINMSEDVFVKFKNEEEHLAALRKMVGMRKEFETRVREIMAKRKELQVAQ